MTEETKQMLLALIRGLTTRSGETQYYEGTQSISGANLKTLIAAIKNAPVVGK